MPLIDRTYFTGMLSIAQSEGQNKDLLNYYIAQYEPDFMTRYLGYAFYQLVITESSARMTAFKTGTTYTYEGVTHRWNGLAYIIDANTRFSPIANYVYWHYIGENATHIGGVGQLIQRPKIQHG